MTTPAAETAPKKTETATAKKADAAAAAPAEEAPLGSLLNPAPLRPGSNRGTLDALAKEYREGQ